MLSPAYFRFFRELTSNNSKAWFDENRSRYERDVKRPFHAMITAWIEAVQPFDPELQASASDVIYRINRDIRFSADKTPYKVQMGAHLNLRGKKAMGFPGVYMEVGAKGGAIAAGSYMPNKEELPALRDLVLHEGADLRAAISTPSFKKLYGELLGEESRFFLQSFAMLLHANRLSARSSSTCGQQSRRRCLRRIHALHRWSSTIEQLRR